MKIIKMSDIAVRKTSAPSGSYHRDKRQEEKRGKFKHPGKSFQEYMEACK